MLDNVTFDVNVLITESVGGKRTQGQGKKKNPDAKLSVAAYEKKAKETSPPSSSASAVLSITKPPQMSVTLQSSSFSPSTVLKKLAVPPLTPSTGY